MRKLFILIFTVLAFTACEKDGKENPLHQKLIGEWRSYAKHWINTEDGGIIVGFPSYGTLYKFDEKLATISKPVIYEGEGLSTHLYVNEPYTVINDSLFVKDLHLKLNFGGDSCVLTGVLEDIHIRDVLKKQ